MSNQNKTLSQTGYKANDRYYFQSLRSNGFKDKDCIFEFIDNSIDSGANEVHVDWQYNKQAKATLQVTDDGCGVHPTSMIESFGVLASETDYQSDDVGKYGIGATAGTINLLTDGTAVFQSTTILEDDWKDDDGTIWKKGKPVTTTLPITHTLQDDVPDFECKVSNGILKSGTSLMIPNIDSTFDRQNTLLKRDIGVIYYPNSVRRPNSKIYVNSDKIKMNDPFYRDYKGKEPNLILKDYTVKIGNVECDILVTGFLPDFNTKDGETILSSWDKDGKNGYRFKPRNSGLYVKVGGRYITTGEGKFPGRENTKIGVLNNLRIELSLPRDIMDSSGVHNNKSLITFDMDNPNLQGLYQIIREIVSMFIRKTQSAPNNQVSKKQKDLAKDVQSALNKMLTGKFGPVTKSTKGSTTLTTRTRNTKPKKPLTGTVIGTGLGTKHSKTKALATYKPDILFSFENEGLHSPMYSWDRIGNQFSLVFNSGSKWGEMIAGCEKDYVVLTALEKVEFLRDVHSQADTKEAIYQSTGQGQSGQDFLLEVQESILRQTQNMNISLR
jgi:hypothetical protein